MSKNRYAARVDSNQNDIVSALRDIPCVTVEVNHDDVLVGYQGRTYWYEIKNPNTVSTKTGEVRESAIKTSQKKIRAIWTGHYKIVYSITEILKDMGIIK